MAQFTDTTTRTISGLEYGKQHVFTEWGMFDEEDYPLDLMVLTSSTTENAPYPEDGYFILAMVFMNVSDLQNESWDHHWNFEYERGYYSYFDYYIGYSGGEDKGIGADAGTIPSSFSTFRNYQMDEKYWIRMRRESIDGYLYVKVWKENEEEPADWERIYPDSNANNSGYVAVGLGYSGNWQYEGNNNATFYKVLLGTKGDPPLQTRGSAITSFKVNLRLTNKMYGYANTSCYCRIITPFFAWGHANSNFNTYINNLKWLCFYPDTIIHKSNLNGTLLDIQDNPYESNNNWLEAIDENDNINLTTSFKAQDEILFDGEIDNLLYILLRKTSSEGKEPILQFYLLENGVEINRSKKMRVVNTNGIIIKYRFKAYELKNLENPTFTLKITGISHGSELTKRSIEIGALRWCAYFLA